MRSGRAIAAVPAFCHYPPTASGYVNKRGSNNGMGTFSIWHWLVVLVVVLVLFGGGGKISRIMGDFGKGLKSFKKGLKEEEEAGTPPTEDAAKALKSESTTVAEPGPAKEKAESG